MKLFNKKTPAPILDGVKVVPEDSVSEEAAIATEQCDLLETYNKTVSAVVEKPKPPQPNVYCIECSRYHEDNHCWLPSSGCIPPEKAGWYSAVYPPDDIHRRRNEKALEFIGERMSGKVAFHRENDLYIHGYPSNLNFDNHCYFYLRKQSCDY